MILDDTIKGARRVNGRIKPMKPLIFESYFLYLILCSPTHSLFCVYDGYKHYLTNLIQIKKNLGGKNICILIFIIGFMNHFRGFIAVEIPINETIKKLHDEIAKLPTNIKLVELKNIHITLKFLGDTNEDNIENIHRIIQNSVQDIQPFPIQLKGTGVFPNQNYIKVIWIGIEKAEKMSLISSSLNTQLSPLGFKKEKRGFNPHLTIGRVKSANGKDQLIQIIDKYKEIIFDEIIVDCIYLKKSTLTPQGPIYETIKEIKF